MKMVDTSRKTYQRNGIEAKNNQIKKTDEKLQQNIIQFIENIDMNQQKNQRNNSIEFLQRKINNQSNYGMQNNNGS